MLCSGCLPSGHICSPHRPLLYLQVVRWNIRQHVGSFARGVQRSNSPSFAYIQSQQSSSRPKAIWDIRCICAVAPGWHAQKVWAAKVHSISILKVILHIRALIFFNDCCYFEPLLSNFSESQRGQHSTNIPPKHHSRVRAPQEKHLSHKRPINHLTRRREPLTGVKFMTLRIQIVRARLTIMVTRRRRMKKYKHLFLQP